MVSYAIVASVSLAIGAAFTHVCWWRMFGRWSDEHNYRRIRVADSKVRECHDTADHEFRLRRRVERRLVSALDETAKLRGMMRRDRQPRHLRPSAMPDYGRHRIGTA